MIWHTSTNIGLPVSAGRNGRSLCKHNGRCFPVGRQ